MTATTTTTTIHITTQTADTLAAQLAPLGEWKSALTIARGRSTPMLGVFEDSTIGEVILAALGCREAGERAKIVFDGTDVVLVFPDDNQAPEPLEAEARTQKLARDDRARFAYYAIRATQPQPPSPRFG